MAGKSAQVKTFACPACSASISIRGLGQTSTLACEYCGSLVDVANPDYKLLKKAKKLSAKPLLPLGSRGEFFGTQFELIGFFIRSDGTGEYRWSEYLLFNPYKGFRWLVESQGHWSFIETVPENPNTLSRNRASSSRPVVAFRGKKFRHFLSGTAVVREVIGECFWRVEVGETVQVHDYICPPEILSIEKSKSEQNVSIGTYLKPSEVRSAFKTKTRMPRQKGVAPNQPNPHRGRIAGLSLLAAIVLSLATLLQVYFSATAKQTQVLKESYSFSKTNQVVVSEPFELIGDVSNLELTLEAPVDNAWVYLSASLIAENGEETHEAGVEVSFYHGRDSDGYWSEGSRKRRTIFSEVPPGKYRMRMEPDGSGIIPFVVTLRHDVPYWGTYFAVVFLLALYPFFVLYRYAKFEAKRWAESDYGGG